METKFVKAYCEKTKQYFGLEVKLVGSTYKVTNVTHLTPQEAGVTATEVTQSSFETNKNLLACERCGSRRVGGCSCARSVNQCAPGMEYRFNCVYCDRFKIDYELPSESDMGGARVGDKIVLSQGQEVVIRAANRSALTNIIVGVGWDPVSRGDNMDVDSSVVIMSANGYERDLVYYGDKEHPSKCARLLEDNLTGEHTGNVDSNDDENILVDLKKVPQGKEKLVFLVNIYKCDERRQTLRDVKNFYIRLYDGTTKKPLIEYNVENHQVSLSDTAIVIGVATRKSGGWTFKAIGRSVKVEGVGELRDRITEFI